jgi:hypothetical protein
VNHKEFISFRNYILSLKRELGFSIPLLLELAARMEGSEGALKSRIDRRYLRLCRMSNELGQLDFKKAAFGASPGVTTLEDYVFSLIDFSRYQEINEKKFDKLFFEGIKDFSDAFFKKNFGLDRLEIESVMERSYKKTNGFYKLQHESPLILSIMRTLEISPESSSLFFTKEIEEELNILLGFIGKNARLPNTGQLYPFLVSSLDNVIITHEDGMTTKLFLTPQGDLAGTFRPNNKPWTLTLIPAQPQE